MVKSSSKNVTLILFRFSISVSNQILKVKCKMLPPIEFWYGIKILIRSDVLLDIFINLKLFSWTRWRLLSAQVVVLMKLQNNRYL